jgi:hypothetical protein
MIPQQTARTSRKPAVPTSLVPAGLYTSRIIKAGALLADTKTLLAHWDCGASVSDNIARLRRDNVFGKASRSRVEDILAIFRQRFLEDPAVTRALVTLVVKRLPAEALDRLLYFHSARVDRLLHDVVTEFLAPRQARGTLDVTTVEVEATLGRWVQQGRTVGSWSADTTRRIAQGLLSALRDFGVLAGAVKKRIAPVYLPVPAFAYMAFYVRQHQPSGSLLIDHPDWKLFFLTREGVERFLVEAHQSGLLVYHAAGSVVRLEFPVDTLEEFARVLVERAP